MTEILTVYDENRKPVTTKTRREVHQQGLWHETFHCWVIRKIQNRDYVLFQKRSDSVEVSPSLYDITAAGHLLAGETVKEGYREIQEELGIVCQFDDLIPLGVTCQTSRLGSVVEQTFPHVFLLESDQPIETFQLQKEEVSGIIQMEISQGMQLFSNEVQTVPVSGYQFDASGNFHSIETKIRKTDIVPRHGYYMNLLISIERYFGEEHYLSI